MMRKLPAMLRSPENVSQFFPEEGQEVVEALLQDYGQRYDLLRLMTEGVSNPARMNGDYPDIVISLRPFPGGGIDTRVEWRFHAGAPPGWPRLITRSYGGIAPVQVVIPLAALVATCWPIADGASLLYAHSFSSGAFSTTLDGSGGALHYVGITRRGWRTRIQEHVRAAASGSPYHFHRAIREFGVTRWSSSEVIVVGLSHRIAMNFEELCVRKFSLYPNGLNMIPGGYEGLKYLASRGFAVSYQDWENRANTLRRFGEHCERSGRPNPLLAAHWRSPEYAASVICGNPRNFSIEDVGLVRVLNGFGLSVGDIAAQLGVRADRVRRLVGGKTYARV